jgi:hypothetical protein
MSRSFVCILCSYYYVYFTCCRRAFEAWLEPVVRHVSGANCHAGVFKSGPCFVTEQSFPWSGSLKLVTHTFNVKLMETGRYYIVSSVMQGVVVCRERHGARKTAACTSIYLCCHDLFANNSSPAPFLCFFKCPTPYLLNFLWLTHSLLFWIPNV